MIKKVQMPSSCTKNKNPVCVQENTTKKNKLLKSPAVICTILKVQK